MISPLVEKSINSKENMNTKTRILPNNYFFYPAQFWPHKNHIYIIEAFEHFKKNKINIKCIFCGHDKGNLKYIKNEIQKRNLTEYFELYDFLPDDEIINLYKNSTAVIMPSLVGTNSFIHTESFYFKKMVFANGNVLGDDFNERVINLDILKPKDLLEKYIQFKNSPANYDKLIELNFKFYQNSFDKNQLANQYEEIINNYKNFKKLWQN